MILRHAFIPLDNIRLSHLCGSLDEHLRNIEAAFGVSISRRNESFRIEGAKPAAERAVALLQALYDRARKPISAEAFQLALVEALAEAKRVDKRSALHEVGDAASEGDELVLRTRRADLAGRTANQHLYLNNIQTHDITFGIGPAGTGKTFLAVACAVAALRSSASTAQRIILTRPAVEAGERLGFLPGDLAQKVDPYLRPLYDALYDLMGMEKVGRAFEKGNIEIAPLAFMRGRTLSNAVVILDEAQNTTSMQMKMFLTRLGENSRMIVTGDPSQVDLPPGQVSGLNEATRLLANVEGIGHAEFTAEDVVRHELVGRIVSAYDKAAARKREAKE